MSLLEVCVDSSDGIDLCNRAGVDRIELCTALGVGGLTPSDGLMRAAAGQAVPAYALIRPREGNFCFTKQELDIMLHDIERARQQGMSGVVLGAATADKALDVNALSKMCQAAGALQKTLHRVIDTVLDPLLAMEQAIDLGFDNILTSGGAPRVSDAISTLHSLQDKAAGRISIMAGAGLRHEAIAGIFQRTGITHFHASCRQPAHTDPDLRALGFYSSMPMKTDLPTVQHYLRAVRNLA